MEELKADWKKTSTFLRTRLEVKMNYERTFFIAAMVFGMLYLIIMTPNSVYDEDVHYCTSYRYSNVLLGEKFSLEDGSFSMRAEDKKIMEYSIIPDRAIQKRLAHHLFDRDIAEGFSEYDLYATGNIIQHIPQAVGISLGRLLHLNHLWVYYLGRFFNLLCYALLTSFAIRKIPFGKITLLLIGILPISLHQAASYNYDAFLNGISFCFIAYCLYLAFSEIMIRKKEILILCLLSMGVGANKSGVYIVLCGLLLIIPTIRFGSMKKRVLITSLIVGVFLATMYITTFDYTVAAVNNADEWKGEQLYSFSYILKQPLDFIKICINSIVIKGSYYFYSTFGGVLGWTTMLVSYTYINEFVVLIVLSSLRIKKEQQYLKWTHKSWFIAISLALILMLTIVFFIVWTEYGSRRIYGVQGRYFVPILPLVFMALRNNKLVLPFHLDRGIFIAACVIELLILGYLYYFISIDYYKVYNEIIDMGR